MANEFTIAPIRRLLKKAGDLKISEGASEELRRIIGFFGENIANEAVQVALNENRKTVLERDIKQAEKIVLKNEVSKFEY